MATFAWTSERVAEALGVMGTGDVSRAYVGISTDSRTVQPGELFVALEGESFDGADYVGAAVEAGASGAVVGRRLDGLSDEFELFVVEDTLVALAELARARRSELGPTVVAITGTSGKTTTREFTVAALGPQAAASPANFNNLVGVPLSMLAAPQTAEFWVLELASNQRGEIEQLGRIAQPDVGMITSVGEGHLEGLGDSRGVLDEKLSLLPAIRPGGSAVVSDDPPELAEAARRGTPDVLVAGVTEEADERAEDWSVGEGEVSWTWRGVKFRVPGLGVHMVRNGVLAAVAARLLGVEPERAAERMRRVRPLPMRGEVRQIGELTLLVDCYNANPSSFKAALESLEALAGERRCAVLAGSMLELGSRSKELHARVAGWMDEARIDVIAATGQFAGAFKTLASGSSTRGIIAEEDVEVAYRELAARLAGDEVVLLKASRGVGLERVIPLFERDFGTGDQS
ncbi:MAG: UDP-N-acetylmuramoyl-tripeptide--D-alanyl-D-alanine ligase [Gemmatimonadota bacterium]